MRSDAVTAVEAPDITGCTTCRSPVTENHGVTAMLYKTSTPCSSRRSTPIVLRPGQRNILRFIFLDARARVVQYDWESVARFALGAFRVDAARAGAAAEVEPLVDELSRLSPEFKAMWRDNDVRGAHGETVKHIRHPVLGPLAFEYSAFAVDGRPDLSMVVYNPAAPADVDKIRSLMGEKRTASI